MAQSPKGIIIKPTGPASITSECPAKPVRKRLELKLMIKELRIAAGLTQQELANAPSIPQRTYGSMNAKSALCDALGCTPNDLVGRPINGLTPDESTLVKNYRAYNEPARTCILEVAENSALATFIKLNSKNWPAILD